MMKVAVLNFKGVVASSVAGPYDMFSKVKSIAAVMNVKTKTTFEVDIVDSNSLDADKPFNIEGNINLKTKKVYDLVLIPAVHFDQLAETLQRERDMIAWILKQHKKGAGIASICTGAFFVASTGLLNGKRTTTHWMGSATFRQLFPKVKLEDDKIIIDDGRFYSSGGAFSFTSFVIYLIEKFCGREMAFTASKIFMVQVHDSSQHTFSVFNLQRNHEDYEIGKVQDYIENNYEKVLKIDRLAEKFNMSSRTFIRKFTSVTGNAPLEYIQRVRMEAAKRFLENGKLTVEQVCMEIGYSDFGFFRNIFKRLTGLTPQEYKRKFGQMFKEPVAG